MSIVNNAYKEILEKSGHIDNRDKRINYSGHFKNYNSNARYTREWIVFNLSKNWKNIDDDIQQGLIESLLVRIYKLKGIKTDKMILYESFMKNLSKYAKKHTSEPELEASFNRINERMFSGMMDKPNLIWAGENLGKLGSYEYSSDTIYMSTIFQGLDAEDITHLDYVMYHELLHKKHQFQMKDGRHKSHTKAFRIDEAKYSLTAEADLNKFLRRKRLTKHIPKAFKFW